MKKETLKVCYADHTDNHPKSSDTSNDPLNTVHKLSFPLRISLVNVNK